MEYHQKQLPSQILRPSVEEESNEELSNNKKEKEKKKENKLEDVRKTAERATSPDRLLQYSKRNALLPTSNPTSDHTFSVLINRQHPYHVDQEADHSLLSQDLALTT